MDAQGRTWTVLARIPDLDVGSDDAAEEETGMGLPRSTGRLLRQALSFRLLAGAAVLLLIAAVVPLPFPFGAKTSPADPSPTADSVTTWHRDSTSSSAAPRA